jgi:hypothetical protein
VDNCEAAMKALVPANKVHRIKRMSSQVPGRGVRVERSLRR